MTRRAELHETNIPGYLQAGNKVLCPSCFRLRDMIIPPATHWWLREGVPAVWSPGICDGCFEELDALAARRNWGSAPRRARLPHPDYCQVCRRLTAATLAVGMIDSAYEASYVCERGHAWNRGWRWSYRVDPRAVMVLIDEGDCWMNR